MGNLSWAPIKIKLGQIRPWADNPRLSTKAQAERLIQSERELGQVQTIAIGPQEPDGMFPLYDGHQRYSSWLTVKGNDYEMTALQSNRPLTEDERRKMSILLHTATGGWNWDTLAGWQTGELREWGLVNQENIKGWQNDISNAKELLSAEQVSQDAEPEIDRAAGLLEKWQVKTGDLWQIGEHRLICGDCTDAAVVAQVMDGERADMVFTDPPYGVAVGDKNKYLNSIAPSNRVEENLENDTLDEAGLVVMLCGSFDNAIEHCTAGASWYVAAPAGPLHNLFGQVLKDRGIWRQTIQWVKNNSTFSPMGVCYHWQAEPIFFGWLPNGGHRFYGGRTQTTVWNIDRPTKSPEHPTMKPVELVQRAVENSSQGNEIVYDCFVGSGTTLVACQNLNRRCRAIEISPAYVAVALERMSQAFPGIDIKRI